nr:ferrous iron transport protein A [uncultured Merdimonas sp.]
MTLKQGKSNQTYRVEAIHTSLDVERRLEALGLTEGSLITILNNHKKGALTARFRGARFALGRQIAEKITISEVDRHE